MGHWGYFHPVRNRQHDRPSCRWHSWGNQDTVHLTSYLMWYWRQIDTGPSQPFSAHRLVESLWPTRCLEWAKPRLPSWPTWLPTASSDWPSSPLPPTTLCPSSTWWCSRILCPSRCSPSIWAGIVKELQCPPLCSLVHAYTMHDAVSPLWALETVRKAAWWSSAESMTVWSLGKSLGSPWPLLPTGRSRWTGNGQK